MLDLTIENPGFVTSSFKNPDNHNALKGFDQLNLALKSLAEKPEKEFLGKKYLDEDQIVKNQKLIDLINAGAAATAILSDDVERPLIEITALITVKQAAREQLYKYCADKMGRDLNSHEMFALNIAFKL